MPERFTTAVPVRYRDLDPADHVNQAVYATYLEQARVAYAETVLDVGTAEFPFFVATLTIDYRQPITARDEPEVTIWTTDLGESSWTQAYEIGVDNTVVATAETTLVHVDLETGAPTSIPDEIRAAVIEFEDLEV